MLNGLCAEGINHAPETNLPTTTREYKALRKRLEQVEQMPIRCCFNCGMVNYPAAGDTICVKANDLSDLRAWRVYGDMIKSGQLATFTTYYASFNSWFGSLTEVRVPVASPSPLPRRPCARPPCSPVSGSL